MRTLVLNSFLFRYGGSMYVYIYIYIICPTQSFSRRARRHVCSMPWRSPAMASRHVSSERLMDCLLHRIINNSKNHHYNMVMTLQPAMAPWARQVNEPSSARLAIFASQKIRLGSARWRLASRLEPAREPH